MSKIFFIFVIVAFVYCAEAENAEGGQYPLLNQAVGPLRFMSPVMDQMRNMMNPEYWKQQTRDGEMMVVQSSAPANGKPTSKVTLLTKQDGKLEQHEYTNP